jgi:hypothetical protein
MERRQEETKEGKQEMKTLAALLSRLQTKEVTREMRFLCELIDAHRLNVDTSYEETMQRIESLERKVGGINARLTRSDSE